MDRFEVEIRPDAGAGKFRVEVVSSPDGGVASAVAELDLPALLARRRTAENAVLVSGVSARQIFPEEEEVRDVGRTLFAALLGTGEVAGRYRAAAAVVAQRDAGLRVVLRIADPALAALPWEAMYDEPSAVTCAGGNSWSGGWACPRPCRRSGSTRRCGSSASCRRRAGSCVRYLTSTREFAGYDQALAPTPRD